MEPKKLDSMRERQGNIAQVAAPSVSAPTLSKLLAAETPNAPAQSSMNAVTSHGGVLTKVCCNNFPFITCAEYSNKVRFALLLLFVFSHFCIAVDLGTRIRMHALQENFEPCILVLTCTLLCETRV